MSACVSLLFIVKLSGFHVLLIACDSFYCYINLVDCDKIALNHIDSAII